MRSLERRFKALRKKDSDLSSFICFGRAVTSQRFSKRTIQYWFRRLVDKDDYEVRDKGRLLRHMYELSKNYK